jgi:hypothetical protein
MANMKPVLRDGPDGEMMSKAQNGVEELKITDAPIPTATPTQASFFKPAEPVALPVTPAPTPVIEEISTIKSPSTGFRNMQESTLDKERKLFSSFSNELVLFVRSFVPSTVPHIFVYLLPLHLHLFEMYVLRLVAFIQLK